MRFIEKKNIYLWTIFEFFIFFYDEFNVLTIFWFILLEEVYIVHIFIFMFISKLSIYIIINYLDTFVEEYVKTYSSQLMKLLLTFLISSINFYKV